MHYISDPVSALSQNISAKEPVESKADIMTKADEGSDMKTTRLWSFYHILGTRRHFSEIVELQCYKV